MNSPGVLTVYRWELLKLRYQKRTYLGLGAAAIVPILFVVATHFRHRGPEDVPFGSYINRSGLAIPLVILLFGAIWMYPLITALVAGDIFASEDHNGTLKTIFTRSLERGQIFRGKALAAATYAIAAIFLSGTVAVVAGSIQSGFNPLQSLSGTTVSAPKALELVYVSLLVYLIPIGAIVCIGLLLSSLTRNSAAAVVGTLMVSLLIQLVGILPGLTGLHPYLLSTQFNAWQGLLRTPIDWAPIVRAAWVSALYGLPALAAAYLVFLRRDVAGGVTAGRAALGTAQRGVFEMTSEPRVLVVDDDPPLRRMLERTLVAEGFDVTVAADGGAALVAAERTAPDVIVLDVAMPVLDGLAVCRRLRHKGLPTPILMLTARDAVPDRVAGLEAGADDYLVKPFAVPELIARIRALTRRGIDIATRLSYADLTLDTDARLASRGGRSIELTGREVDLLELLLRDPGRTLTRDRAIDEIWGGAAEPNVVDRYVTRLRRKLGEPPLIRTVRGAGFSLRA